MSNSKFNPDDVGISNGNYFGFPNNPEKSDIVLISVPWDVTTSYKPGTADGPEAIIEASVQLDFFDFEIPNAWETKISSLPINKEIVRQNQNLRPKAEEIIRKLESGEHLDEPLMKKQATINTYSEKLNELIKYQSLELLKTGAVVGVVGGDHSSPLGLIHALSEQYADFGILHIDAHADLRKCYEGFEFSHASIMYNALKLKNISRIVQVGIRDISSGEMELIEQNERLLLFSDYTIKSACFNGTSWDLLCDNIIAKLPQNLYISFDIDGLSPEFCPNTGTPVPGGLTFNEAIHLLHKLHRSSKKIIGFDLCEVAVSANTDWDANVGARILYKLCLIAASSNKMNI